MIISFNVYATLLSMIFVLLLGRFIIGKVKVLRDFNIPEPVVGGIIAAIVIFLLYHYGKVELKFDGSLKDPLMLAFFTSIGLSADFASLKKGGKLLILFLFIVTGLLILQNLIGMSVATLLGVNPVIGLLGGSITMSGGHGTGAAWADLFKNAPYHFGASMEVAMASATFGLVMGGIVGGPVARFLVKKYQLESDKQIQNDVPVGFEKPEKERLITAGSFVESLALITIALFGGTEIAKFFQGGGLLSRPLYGVCSSASCCATFCKRQRFIKSSIEKFR